MATKSTIINGDSTLANGNGPLSNSISTEHGEVKTSSEPIPIAIIGMACRTPGKVSSPEDLWVLCSQQRSGWSKVPRSRFNHEAFYHPNPSKAGCMNPQGAHFLQDDISHFDNSFFRITDKEASSIDPQQRILLECAYEAIENASVSLDTLAGKDVGVFAAQSFSEYAVQLFRDPETIPMFKATGCSDALMSNRISYAFDLRGPSMTVDTACSSSLTALHLACQSLRAGDSTMAIAGGCHVNLTPDDFISFSMSK
ncbi:MAG: hypothetical protein LQ337_005419 [Flavoplaca oasis]|nr:MAG: hypothetical protein LQ337_005419 [Flavoplaca oasis]